MTHSTFSPRSALYLPASNARAIEKARGLDADMIMLDLEDAVPPDRKDEARAAAVAAVETGFGCPVAIRINAIGSEWHTPDLDAVAHSRADYMVLPKVESPRALAASGKPLLAMIETPDGVQAAATIARQPGVAGLIAGTNDLKAELRIPSGAGREGLVLALQTIVLAARGAGIIALDGVWNRLDDPAGLEEECRQGRAFGFDGKTVIHPAQIEIANRLFGPDAAELEDARALIAAFDGGAVRFRDRMIESMHVDAARRLIGQAEGLRRTD
jgi:citrate lyase subunit beta/citryl-CoA lyase